MFELFIASRHLRAKRKQAVISVITVISILGVTAGVMALVIALAVNNGFRNALERKSDRAVPLEFFRDVLDKHFSQEDVQHQLDAALNWGRYAEIFTYDSQSDRLLLDEAANVAHPNKA